MGYDEDTVEDMALSELEGGDGEREREREQEKEKEKRRPRAMSGSSQLSRRVSRLSENLRDAHARRRELAEAHKEVREVPVAVVEQRVSNLAQGALCEL
jgi:hypothetical protein